MSENIEKKSGGGIISRLNLFLTFLLLAIVISLAYYGFMLKQHTDLQIRMLDIAVKHNWQKLVYTEDQIETMQEDLKQISNSQIEVYQISELVALANQVLVVYGDTNGCLRLLNYAKNQLSAKNNPEFDNLKVALGYDMERLQDSNVIDKVTLSGELDGLNDEIATIHLDNTKMTNVYKKTVTTEDSKWQRFLNNIKDTLYGLVAISKTSKANILVPPAENIAKENMRFDLFSAKVALLGHDEKSWEYNLQNTNYYLETYFKEYAGVDKITIKIDELLKINVANDKVNIDATIKAMNKLKALD